MEDSAEPVSGPFNNERVIAYDDFVDELVNKHKVGPQIFLLKGSAEVMNSPHDRPQKFKSQSRDNLAAGRCEHEKQLVPLDVDKLDALSLLQTNILIQSCWTNIYI